VVAYFFWATLYFCKRCPVVSRWPNAPAGHEPSPRPFCVASRKYTAMLLTNPISNVPSKFFFHFSTKTISLIQVELFFLEGGIIRINVSFELRFLDVVGAFNSRALWTFEGNMLVNIRLVQMREPYDCVWSKLEVVSILSHRNTCDTAGLFTMWHQLCLNLSRNGISRLRENLASSYSNSNKDTSAVRTIELKSYMYFVMILSRNLWRTWTSTSQKFAKSLWGNSSSSSSDSMGPAPVSVDGPFHQNSPPRPIHCQSS